MATGVPNTNGWSEPLSGGSSPCRPGAPTKADEPTTTQRKFAAVVREWQQRFGATVVGLSFDTLTLSIAAPPATMEHALRVAAEHFVFCPDNIWQSDTDTLPTYASAIQARRCWTFW